MRLTPVLLPLTLAIGALLLPGASGHGGTYRGPGDTVPPGGGGGGGGGGPDTPNPSGPSNPGGSTPGTGQPGRPAPPGPSGGPSQGGPVSGGSGAIDLTPWQYWWGFNKDPYLNLESHLHGSPTQTGSDDFFLGHGQEANARESYAPSEAQIREEIVPALLRVLESERNNDLVTGALLALAKIGDEPGEDGVSRLHAVIRHFLTAPEQDIAETAAVALGVLGHPGSVEELTALAMDSTLARRELVQREAGVPHRTRTFATFGLAQVGHLSTDPELRREIVATLWTLCESPRSATRDLKVAAVIGMGLVPLDPEPLEVPALARETDSPAGPPTTRQEQLTYLIEFFESEGDRARPRLARAHAPRSLARLLEGADELTPQVVEALLPYVTRRGNHGARELRQGAAQALGQIADLDAGGHDAAARAALIDAMGNNDQLVKRFCVIALGEVAGRPGQGTEPLAGLEEARAVLLRNLARGKSQLKPWCALALGLSQRELESAGLDSSPAVAFALREGLRDAKAKDRLGAFALACGLARDDEAQELLLEKLALVSEDEPRGFLALSLGLIPAGGARSDIEEIVRSSRHRPELLKQAAIALGLLGDKRVVDLLTQELSHARTLSTQAALASALGSIGDARSVTPLVQMLEDDTLTGAARGFAAVALGIVADQEALPWNSKFAVRVQYGAGTETLSGGGGTGLLDLL